MRIRTVRIAGIALFCTVLAAGFFSTWLLPQKEYSKMENRALETRPDGSISEILSGEFQEHYEKYLNDQMCFRDQWVSMAVGLEYLFGKRDINGVYIGRDGYLIEKYEESGFEDAQIAENVKTLSGFLNDAVKQFGKQRVSCLMLPAKETALPKKLPHFAPQTGRKETDTIASLRRGLEEPDLLLDMANVLKKHQDEYIYYRTDHHWTPLGAYYAYCAWAEQTGHTAHPIGDYSRETVFTDFYGTTYNKVHLPVPMDHVELFGHPNQEGVSVVLDGGEIRSSSFYFRDAALEGFNRYNLFFSKNTAQIEIKTNAHTGRALLVVKDSFANCFVPFLAGDYDKIVMVDFRYGKNDIYDILKMHEEITDVLVMYNVRKFMQDTNLKALDKKSDTMEEFRMEDFLSP